MDELFEAARAVQARAHAPYSRFAVGAAVRAGSGRVYVGCNVENASFPEGTCAEANAIGAMVAAGEREIVEVLTVADGDGLVTCCGGCRQRIREFAAARRPRPRRRAGGRPAHVHRRRAAAGVVHRRPLADLTPVTCRLGGARPGSGTNAARRRIPPGSGRAGCSRRL